MKRWDVWSKFMFYSHWLNRPECTSVVLKECRSTILLWSSANVDETFSPKGLNITSFTFYLTSWNTLLIDLQVLWSLWDNLERVHQHIPREGDVEVTEPQELSAMAKHGILKTKRGLFKRLCNTFIRSHFTVNSVPRLEYFNVFKKYNRPLLP